MTLLRAQYLRKSYDGLTRAVDEVSISVAGGEVVGLLGPNGAGKTTTMLMLSGLLRPDNGSVEIDGESFKSGRRQLRGLLGVVPQELAIYPELSARENLAFFGRLYGISGKRLREGIGRVLEIIGLGHNGDSPVKTFSGGMKRRLNFGIGLVHEPRLLILDEPTAGVDPQSRAHLLAQVRDVSGQGVGVIYASHYMEEVQAVCDRVAIMDHGRIMALDSLENLLRRTTGKVKLHVTSWSPHLADLVAGLADVVSVSDREASLAIDNISSVPSGRSRGPLVNLLTVLGEHGVHIEAIDTDKPNLESLFLALTGRQLRD
ncbi:MAG: ABC transporter ATP-binding protein [Planctomycetota bacterium]